MLLLIVLTCLNKVLENPCCIRRPRQAKTTLNSVCLQLVESLNATSRGIHPPFIHDAGPGENRKKSPRPFRWDRILWNTQYPVCGENTQKFAWKFNYIRMYGARSFFSYFLFHSLVFPIFYSLAFSILYICLLQYYTSVFSIFYISLFNIVHLSFQYFTLVFSIFYISLFNILH